MIITRAAALRLLLSAAALPGAISLMRGSSAPARAMTSARRDSRELLARVRRWGCQYQNIDLASIAATPLDLVILEPIIDGGTGRAATREEIAALKVKPDGGRRLVLAYLSVGAAEEYRPYWQQEWKSQAPPEWLGPENPDWPRSYAVRYWLPEWQELVGEGLIRLVETGFDGVFLDRADGFHDWRESRPTAQEDMANFVVGLARAARSRNSGFLLVSQNAEQLLRIDRYLGTIDAVSKESLLTGLRGQGVPNTPEEIEWSLGYLKPVRAAGLTVLTIEYLDVEAQIAAAATHHAELGFIPFFGHRLLDRLP